MKTAWNMLLLLILFYCCNTQDKSNEKNIATSNIDSLNSNTRLQDSLFQYHFKILDSIIKIHPKDTFYYETNPSIRFMETNTTIEAHSEGTQLGRLGFTKKDLENWHEWYEKKGH